MPAVAGVPPWVTMKLLPVLPVASWTPLVAVVSAPPAAGMVEKILVVVRVVRTDASERRCYRHVHYVGYRRVHRVGAIEAHPDNGAVRENEE